MPIFTLIMNVWASWLSSACTYFQAKRKKKVIFRLCSIFSVPSADFRPFSEMQVCMKGLNYEYEGKYTLLMSLFHFDLVFFFKVYGLNKLKTFTLCYIGWSTSCKRAIMACSPEPPLKGSILDIKIWWPTECRGRVDGWATASLCWAAARSWGHALTATCHLSGDLGTKVLLQVRVIIIFIVKWERNSNRSLSESDLRLLFIFHFNSWGQGFRETEEKTEESRDILILSLIFSWDLDALPCDLISIQEVATHISLHRVWGFGLPVSSERLFVQIVSVWWASSANDSTRGWGAVTNSFAKRENWLLWYGT